MGSSFPEHLIDNVLPFVGGNDLSSRPISFRQVQTYNLILHKLSTEQAFVTSLRHVQPCLVIMLLDFHAVGLRVRSVLAFCPYKQLPGLLPTQLPGFGRDA